MQSTGRPRFVTWAKPAINRQRKALQLALISHKHLVNTTMLGPCWLLQPCAICHRSLFSQNSCDDERKQHFLFLNWGGSGEGPHRLRSCFFQIISRRRRQIPPVKQQLYTTPPVPSLYCTHLFFELGVIPGQVLDCDCLAGHHVDFSLAGQGQTETPVQEAHCCGVYFKERLLGCKWSKDTEIDQGRADTQSGNGKSVLKYTSVITHFKIEKLLRMITRSNRNWRVSQFNVQTQASKTKGLYKSWDVSYGVFV
jgi:hypothetical protein